MFWSTKDKTDWNVVRMFLTQQSKRLEYTPHAGALGMYEWQWLFVPDEYKFDHANFKEIKDRVEVYGEGWTNRGFQMLKTNMDRFGETESCIGPDGGIRIRGTAGKKIYPIILPGGTFSSDTGRHSVPNARIKGDLMLVKPSVLIDLDKHRENGVHFLRRRVRIILPFTIQALTRAGKFSGRQEIVRKKSSVFVKAWMYIGNPTYWKIFVDNGNMFRVVNRYRYVPDQEDSIRIGSYYFWSKTDYYGV